MRWFGNDTQAVQDAINHVANSGNGRVVVNEEVLPYDASSVTFDPSVQVALPGTNDNVYNVRAYGASLSGGTDGASWAAAVDGLSGGDILYHPGGDGTSIVANGYPPLILPAGVTVRGQVNEFSRVRLGANQDSNLFESESWGSPDSIDGGIRIEHMDLRGNYSKNTTGTGLALQTAGAKLVDCQISDFADHGVHLRAGRNAKPNGNKLFGCRVARCEGYGLWVDGVFDTIISDFVGGNCQDAQVRVDTGITQFDTIHLFAGRVNGSDSTPGRGLELRSPEVHLNDIVIEKTQREAIRIIAEDDVIRVVQINGCHIENCCQETNNTFNAIHLEPKGNDDTISGITLKGATVDSPEETNIPRFVVGGSGDGAAERLILSDSHLVDFSGRPVDNRILDPSQIEQSNLFIEEKSTKQKVTGTIPDGNKSASISHDVWGVPRTAIPIPVSEATALAVTGRHAGSVEVTRNGNTGDLDLEVIVESFPL